MELPEELLLVICEHLQPPRYEDEAALRDDYDASAAHRPAAAVKLVSRGFRGLMARTARVVMAKDYRSWAEFAAQTHRHAELFEATRTSARIRVKLRNEAPPRGASDARDPQQPAAATKTRARRRARRPRGAARPAAAGAAAAAAARGGAP